MYLAEGVLLVMKNHSVLAHMPSKALHLLL